MGTLSQRISGQVHSLRGLQTHLEGIRDYLGKVAAGQLPINHTILYQLQDIFNLLPNLSLEEFTKAFAVKMNDQLLVVYLASLVRSVIALHNLIGNKIGNNEAEGGREKDSKKDKDKEKEKEKESKKDGKDGEGEKSKAGAAREPSKK